MRGREEERMALMPSSATSFVRNSSLRTSRRYRLQEPSAGTGPYVQSAVWTYQRPSSISSSSLSAPLLQNRPPLPPFKNAEDASKQHRRPPSPASARQPHCKDLLKKSHSYGTPSSCHGAAAEGGGSLLQQGVSRHNVRGCPSRQYPGPASHSPGDKPTPPAQGASRSTQRSSWCHTVIARLQGRSLSSSPHRSTPPASPSTFRRVPSPSDALTGGLGRYRSLPMQKTSSEVGSWAEMEPALTRDKLSKSNSSRQAPVDHRQGLSPWGEGAYMPWPLRPYRERDLHTTPPHNRTGTTPSHGRSIKSTDEDQQRRRSVSLTASLPGASPPEVEKESTFDPDELQKSPNSRTWEGNANYNNSPQLRSRRSRSLGNDSHTHQVTPIRGVYNHGFVSSDPAGDARHSGSFNSSGSLVAQRMTSQEVREILASPEHRKDTVACPEHPGNTGSPSGHLDSWDRLPWRGSDSWPHRRARSQLGSKNCHFSYGSSESADSQSARNSCSSDGEQDVWEWLVSEPEVTEESIPKAQEPCIGQFSFLVKNDSDYVHSLKKILDDHHSMCQRTPPHIRQHFDVFFKQMELIYHFQIMLHERIIETAGDTTQLALVFQDEQFRSYYRCMVLTPTVQKELQRYSLYFDEHFPELKRNILKPSLRINFYAMILESYKKEASGEERKELQCAVDRLNLLKSQANTEMTIASVASSPVDLRLGGDMIHSGELFCLGGGSLLKKKYNLILFENLLVVTSPKMSFFKYKVHFRAEQVVRAEAAAEHDLLLQVLTEGQAHLCAMKFKAKTSCLRDQWVSELKRILPHATAVSSDETAEDITCSRGTTCKLRPLNLLSVHPHLLTAMRQEQPLAKLPQVPVSGDHYQQLILQERKYVKHLSWLLHPDAPIPTKICILFEKLHNIHSKRLLPCLERSEGVSDVLRCFRENLEALEVYSDYLVVRCKAASDMETSNGARLYISPVQHFIFYMVWLQHLCHTSATSETALPILLRLRRYVKTAQVRLLTESIVNGRIDFNRSGDIVRYDNMEVKTRKKELRCCSYYVLLFEKAVILTRPKPPNYEYAWDIWLDQVNLGPPTASDLTFKLEVRQGGGKEPVTYEFRTCSAEVKQEWLRHLQQQMLQQAEKIRHRTSDL